MKCCLFLDEKKLTSKDYITCSHTGGNAFLSHNQRVKNNDAMPIYDAIQQSAIKIVCCVFSETPNIIKLQNADFDSHKASEC